MMFKPDNLITTYSSAKIQEEHLGVTKRNYKGILPFPEQGASKHQYVNHTTATKGLLKAQVPVQKINQNQMKNRREKCLYYYYASKWNLVQKFPNPKLFLIEELENGSGEETGQIDDLVEEEFVNLQLKENQLEISLHALVGSQNSKTMKIKGKVENQAVVVLIDSSSTHNFLKPSVVRKWNFLVHGKERVKIKVANVKKISSEGRCPKLKFKLQGVEFMAEVHVLVLAGHVI